MRNISDESCRDWGYFLIAFQVLTKSSYWKRRGLMSSCIVVFYMKVVCGMNIQFRSLQFLFFFTCWRNILMANYKISISTNTVINNHNNFSLMFIVGTLRCDSFVMYIGWIWDLAVRWCSYNCSPLPSSAPPRAPTLHVLYVRSMALIKLCYCGALPQQQQQQPNSGASPAIWQTSQCVRDKAYE